MDGFCPACPDDVKTLSRAYNRAVYRMKNLEAYIERVSPYEFDAAMDELEQAQEQVRALGIQFDNARRAWEWSVDPLAQSGEAAK